MVGRRRGFTPIESLRNSIANPTWYQPLVGVDGSMISADSY
jgi:hypothetical protein